ncbi:carbohydrate kinase family protein [Flavihumibacter solisilvae]|uniref:Carbohydrate kinase PfkB domain-containing protein n=1 Tax=Flavihumibacter solisilvae TaxID=1349421 RepID=A0A0C1IPP7_9BACT|nr:carbohydrate kinase [Flavihumibacter solisilvae]KIC96210.1 hypothetical protein OI18_00070 [Flavihumibacter solisilvae]
MKETKTIACFGEILWDILPTGKVLGGAPLNACYHISKLGINSAMISRIGRDDLGREIKEELAAREINDRYTQEDADHVSGQVLAFPDAAGVMTYQFVDDVAWDHIQADKDNRTLVEQADYFVYGSLVARGEVSRKTLFELLKLANIKVLDINLRKPYYTGDMIELLLGEANLLKVNDDELQLLAKWFLESGTEEEWLQELAAKFNLDDILVTKGPNGATAWIDNRYWTHPGYPAKVQDTIGSGDSFLAAYLTARIRQADPADALDQANRLASYITTLAGGCPTYDAADAGLLIQ